MRKVCTICKIEKSYSEFYTKKKTGLPKSECKICTIVSSQNWKKNNKEKYEENKLKSRLNKYGLTLEEYDTLVEKQKGLCAICGRKESIPNKSLSVDHCHNTGKPRELLCNKCNTGLGMFKDDIKIVENAIKYLERFEHEHAS